MQFASDNLVAQIVRGEKTASVARLEEVAVDEDENNHALVVGEYYTVYDDALNPRCTIRITGMELCRWDDIPEQLWRGETNDNADGFKEDHWDWFDHPADNFEFVAYYFRLIDRL